MHPKAEQDAALRKQRALLPSSRRSRASWTIRLDIHRGFDRHARRQAPCQRLIRIDGDPKLEFKMDEISEALGRPMTPHLFEISTSTHYGRMVMVDDNTVVCFGNMDEALAFVQQEISKV